MESQQNDFTGFLEMLLKRPNVVDQQFPPPPTPNVPVTHMAKNMKENVRNFANSLQKFDSTGREGYK